jgi:hypothetical protein
MVEPGVIEKEDCKACDLCYSQLEQEVGFTRGMRRQRT